MHFMFDCKFTERKGNRESGTTLKFLWQRQSTPIGLVCVPCLAATSADSFKTRSRNHNSEIQLGAWTITVLWREIILHFSLHCIMAM
eukprot:6464571-Amphidinium_carterae.2